jgi:hypothetical protein
LLFDISYLFIVLLFSLLIVKCSEKPVALL